MLRLADVLLVVAAVLVVAGFTSIYSPLGFISGGCALASLTFFYFGDEL